MPLRTRSAEQAVVRDADPRLDQSEGTRVAAAALEDSTAAGAAETAAAWVAEASLAAAVLEDSTAAGAVEVEAVSVDLGTAGAVVWEGAALGWAAEEEVEDLVV